MYIFIKGIIQTFFYSYICEDFFESLYKKFLMKNFDKFINHKIRKDTILITEAIYTHAEVIPGLVKYCLDLGYNVDILLTDDNYREKPCEMFKNNKKVRTFSLILPHYIQALHLDKINQYKYVIFSSSRVYYEFDKYKERFVLDYINTVIPKEKTILIEHHLDLIDKKTINNYKIAALPVFCDEKEIKRINPHYFGNIKQHNKNKITKFVIAGNIEKERKNYDLLINSVKELLDKGITNFEIKVIGNGHLEIKDKKVAEKIQCTGRLSYKDLYKNVEKADYLIALLDKENPSHQRYIKDGTSGTFQLSYGFLKPIIINEYFATPHKHTKDNSIIYNNNEDLTTAMETAIKQDKKDYNKLVQNLKTKEKEIYNESLKNMKEYIN